MNPTHPWLRSVFAALISGFAHGSVAVLSAMVIDPTHFNFDDHFWNMVRIAVISGALGGVVSLLNFLAKSPLPED